jgi:hypothetical protein
MSTIALSRRYVTVKRKATEEPSIGLKRCKFVGSCDTRSEEHVVALVKTISPALETQAIEITDYEQFVLKEKRASFPKIKEVISCNGVPLIANTDKVEEAEEEESYVYDVYLYEPENEDEELALETYREENDQEYSSNDEDHPYNDYPDEDEHDFGDTDFYRTWEDDGCREMMQEFERNRIQSETFSDGEGDL